MKEEGGEGGESEGDGRKGRKEVKEGTRGRRKCNKKKKGRGKLCENIRRGRRRERASESARDEGVGGNHRVREKGGRRVERSITDGPGVVTLKRVNGQEPNFPPTHFFSLHHQHLSPAREGPSPAHPPALSPPPSLALNDTLHLPAF